MSLSGAISIGSAVIGAYSAYKGSQAAGDAADAQSNAVALQRQQQGIMEARQRRELIRERRIASAQNQARGQAQGMMGGSSIAGIQGALNTNLASNLNFLDVNSSLTSQRASFLDQANAASARSSNYLALSGLGFGVAREAFGVYRNTTSYRNAMASS